MIRLAALVVLLGFACQAETWRSLKTVSLKKDERERILVKSEGLQKLLEFRWTLYANEGLVVLRSFDGFAAQHMLYARDKRRGFRVELMTRGRQAKAVAAMLVTFKAFDARTKEASFELYLRDNDNEIELEYLREETNG